MGAFVAEFLILSHPRGLKLRAPFNFSSDFTLGLVIPALAEIELMSNYMRLCPIICEGFVPCYLWLGWLFRIRTAIFFN